jgi:hypothetical protein
MAMSVPSYESRREAEAALAARRELGFDYEEQIAAGLAERVEQAVWHRQAEYSQRTKIELEHLKDDRKARGQRFALSIVSLGTGIPMTAIAASETGLLGVAVTWGGIVGVNAVFALSSLIRRRDLRR